MATYGWMAQHVRNKLPGGQGWVWYNWALENQATQMGGSLKRTTPGYVGQERDRILKQWAQMAK